MTEDFKSKVKKESETFTENFESEAFIEGVCFALENIWHSSNEEPNYTKGFLYQLSDGRCDVFKGEESKHFFDVLKLLLRDKGVSITQWCYLEDILPEKEPLYWDEEKGTVTLEL